jgi:hypothetical protein
MDRCYVNTQKSECVFLVKIIDSITKLLKDSSALSTPVKFEGSADTVMTVEVNLKGQMMLIYGVVTKQSFPKHYTAADIKLINEIWDYLGHPENKIIF